MSFLEELMSYATLIVVVIIVTIFFAGVPKSEARYRTLALILAALSGLAAANWYMHYVVAQYYFRDEAHWPVALLCGLSVLATIIFSIEGLRPFRFHRGRKAPNQPSQPMPLTRHG